MIAIEKFFEIVVYNYLFSNGDTHLKIFALLESASGDYLLSQTYELINTQIYVDDSDLALSKGLLKNTYLSKTFNTDMTGYTGDVYFIRIKTAKINHAKKITNMCLTSYRLYAHQ